MLIVEIKANELGGHDNNLIHGFLDVIPEGWAVIPDDMVTENFPFGEVAVKTNNGVPTVIKWIPLPMPEPEPEPTPQPTTEQRVTELEEALDMILSGVTE